MVGKPVKNCSLTQERRRLPDSLPLNLLKAPTLSIRLSLHLVPSCVRYPCYGMLLHAAFPIVIA